MHLLGEMPIQRRNFPVITLNSWIAYISAVFALSPNCLKLDPERRPMHCKCKFCHSAGMGPSVKYVTLFLANFDPPPLSHFVTHPGTPPKVRHTSWTLRFLEGLVQQTRTKAPLQLHKFCLNCSRGFLSGGFCQGVFCLEGFVRGGFVRSCSCSVRIHLLHQKIKHHFKFHVSYV